MTSKIDNILVQSNKNLFSNRLENIKACLIMDKHAAFTKNTCISKIIVVSAKH